MTALRSLRSLRAVRSSLHSPSLSASSTLPITRSFVTTHPCKSGLTNIFDTPDLPSLSIAKLTPKGFHLSDDLVVPGGVVFLGGRAMLWDVDPPGDGSQSGGLETAWEGWGEEQFKVFEMVVPRPEILLLGTGLRVVPAPKRIRDYISSLGIQLDVMDSRNAASTYNLLTEEGRTIGAALCPLKPINPRTGGPR